MLTMAKTRDVKMTLRVTQTLRDEFSACAKIQGVTVSSLFNQFMKKTILETKKAMPEEFETAYEEAVQEAADRSEEKKKEPRKLKAQPPHSDMVTVPIIETAPDELKNEKHQIS